MEEGVARVRTSLDAEPRATLRDIEQAVGWPHFPHANLAVDDDERGNYESPLDSGGDTYMWLEAYRLLEAKLDANRRAPLIGVVAQVV
jgi:hypothetical protein